MRASEAANDRGDVRPSLGGRSSEVAPRFDYRQRSNDSGPDSYVESVSPERPDRIDTRGAVRWNPGCSQAHRREREHRHCERRRVVS